MTTNSKLPKILKIMTKIFLIGLLIQFFLQTFITYELGYTTIFWKILWMWKEILLVGLLWILIYIIQKNPERSGRKSLRKKLPIKRFIVLFISLIVSIGLISLCITGTGINAFILSIRYSMIGFFIFILFFVLKFIEQGEQGMDMIKRYNNIIKKILIGALIRRWIIRLMPNLLDHFGYNQYNVEGAIGIAPPAAYYTQYNEGYVRNQFLFERPISLWFFLIVFRPLFFIFVIKNRGRKNALWRGGLFGLIVLSTFSRAARIAWFFQTGMLILLQYRKKTLKMLLYWIIPILIIVGGIAYVGRNQIVARSFSDIGHLEMVIKWFEQIKEKPLWGQGAGTAGPASYQLNKEGYNPENQFLQIWIEYGIIGFIGWIALYLYLHKIGVEWYKEAIDPKKSKQDRFYGYIILAFSLGLLGLSIEGLVLHSFVDRMIVYPFMALFGIAYAVYYKNKHQIIK